ncbi:polysaccharide deacetylase family protein [Aureimonas pseudogalii]|uniref:Polysaccharide deacetylase n=1 Tax=Aureimonas pseudogalii TaxID=1744844 RepID=A0A7W6E8T2_9HYPH|nr:polysaccharide deacetylase family protein [Aureimonas pseudogalii]MBB3996369.1 hypothetical protein [Aureimonas pseudogalii]
MTTQPDDAEGLWAELDRWADAGRTLDLWWRDDDACDETSALDRLLALSGRYDLPVALAVVPATATPALVRRLRGTRAAVLQHGWRHANHARLGGRAVECGGDRPVEAVLAEFRLGRERLAALFAARFHPVMVPPWNRIERAVAERLPGEGYRALSGFGPPAFGPGVPNEINADLDVLRWKGGARFAGAQKLERTMREALAARREGGIDRPFGLLTHHLSHDEDTWAFLDHFVPQLAAHPAVRWCDVASLIPPGDDA